MEEDTDKYKHLRTNSKTGFIGVELYGKKFRAFITIDGVRMYLGTYDTALSAVEARYFTEELYKINQDKRVITKNDLTKELLDKVIWYDKLTGHFYWAVNTKSHKKDQRADVPTSNGTRTVYVYGINHMAHNLAWFIVHGIYPTRCYHKSPNKEDNKIENLYVNKPMNRSYIRGVVFNRATHQYDAYALINQQHMCIGSFLTKIEAAEALDKLTDN